MSDLAKLKIVPLLFAATACSQVAYLPPPEPAIAEEPAAAPAPSTPVAPTTSPPPSSTVPECEVDDAVADNPWRMAAADALAHPGFEDVDLSVSVWVEGVGEVVSYEPNLELFPASNQKLFTGVGAYLLLEQDDRFVTTVEQVGDTLILRAGGDPTLRAQGAHSLQALATQTADQLKSSPTRLVIDAGYFEPDVTVSGRLDWQLPTYTGPMSALIVDDNRWRTDDAFIKDPALENGQLFGSHLSAVGLTISSIERIDHYSPEGEVVARLESQSFGELVETMMMSSDNEIAESLLREIGEGSTADGIEAIDATLDGNCPQISGQSGDGSGLSRANIRSARDWRTLLQFVLNQDWADKFLSSLPVAGNSGTLRSRLTGSPTNGIVRAKTGTIIDGRSLSGYGTTSDGQMVAFSVITNGEPAAAQRSLGAIDNLITKIMTAKA